MDLEPSAGPSVPLGNHNLGGLLALDSESALFDLGQGKAAWIHRPDRPERQSFVKRAEGARSARERGLLRVHEVGEFKGLAYAVVDRPKGRNLAQLMQRLSGQGVERLDAAEVLDLGAGLASALSALQATGGLVGDLHPGRVWVNHDGGTLLLAGVGEPPALPPTAERERWAIQAPELSMRREHADGRADLYSLGAVLWTLLTARRHTLKSDWVRTVQATRGAAPLDLASPLHELLAQCMQAEPADRPESAAVLAKALDALRGAQRGAWGPRLLTAFPIGGPDSPSAEERTCVEQITGICTGTAAMPAVQSAEDLDLPDWPLPDAVSAAAPLAEPTPEPVADGIQLVDGAPEDSFRKEAPLAPAALPDAAEPDAAEPEAVESDAADSDEPVAAAPAAAAPGLMERAQKETSAPVASTLEAVPPVSEDVHDDDSLGSGFFAEDPVPNDAALHDGDDDDGLPPPIPQRSWGLAIGGALLGLLLLAGAGYLIWSQSQDPVDPGPATRPVKKQEDAPQDEAVKPANPEAVPVVEEPPLVEEPPVIEEPEPEPEPEAPAVEPEPVKAKPKGPTGNRPAKGTRPTGRRTSKASSADKDASASKAAGGSKSGSASASPPDEEPAEGWEASPWGEASTGSKKEDKVDENGNPWGEVE
jgi:hypothetical protein